MKEIISTPSFLHFLLNPILQFVPPNNDRFIRNAVFELLIIIIIIYFIIA